MKRGEQVIEEHIYFPAPEGGRGVVDFRWVPGHPVYSGNVLNIVEALPGSPDTCRLRFELNWQPVRRAMLLQLIQVRCGVLFALTQLATAIATAEANEL